MRLQTRTHSESPDTHLPGRNVLAWVVGLGALAMGVAIWLHAIWPLTQIGYDFRMYLAAAHDVANGGDLYAQLAALTHDARPGSAGVRASGYVYPPLLAVVLALPVRLGLSDQGVWLLWNLLGAAAILWMGYELNRGLRDGAPTGRERWPSPPRRCWARSPSTISPWGRRTCW